MGLLKRKPKPEVNNTAHEIKHVKTRLDKVERRVKVLEQTRQVLRREA